jgi:predicted HTH transcriptional regulator
LPEQRRRLTDMLRALIRPQPPLHIDANAVEGRNVLVLRVDPNRGQLYALVLDTERSEYYVRRDGTTFPAQPEELTQIVAAQAAAAHAFGNPFGLG